MQPISPASFVAPTSTAASAENSISVKPSSTSVLDMREAPRINQPNQIFQDLTIIRFEDCKDIESLINYYDKNNLSFNREMLNQFIKRLQEVVNEDLKQMQAFNNQPEFKQSLLELVVQHLNLLYTEDVKTILSLLNGITRLPYESSHFRDLSLDGIINTINTTFKISIGYYSMMLNALGKLPLKISDHPAFEKLDVNAVICALNDPKFSWDNNRSYSTVLNALGNLGLRTSFDSNFETLNLEVIIQALKNTSYSWHPQDYSLTILALGKLGYRLNTHPDIEQLNLAALLISLKDTNNPWKIQNYSMLFKGLSRIGYHLKEHSEFRDFNFTVIVDQFNNNLQSVKPISISNLLFSFGKLGFKNTFNWNNLHLAPLKQYILSEAFNTYEKDLALRGWGMLELNSLAQQQTRRVLHSHPLPTVLSANENAQPISRTLPETMIAAANAPIELPKSNLLEIPQDYVLTIQPGEPIMGRIAAVKSFKYSQRMIERLQGDIELHNKNGEKTGIKVNRLEFLRFVALTLQQRGYPIKGIYLMGSMVHELLGYKDRDDARDYDFCIQVDGSAVVQLNIRFLLKQALDSLKITQHLGLLEINNTPDQSPITLLQLGIHDTDITITHGNLKYALLDNATALNITEVLIKWQDCLNRKYPPITQYFLENKKEVMRAIESKQIHLPTQSTLSWDKVAICFKRLSRGEPFADPNDAIELYNQLSEALLLADHKISNPEYHNDFNKNLEFRNMIYQRFQQLPNSALLHGILDIAVRMDELQKRQSWTPEQTQALKKLLKTLTNWFNDKATQEKRLCAVANQLETFNNDIEVFAKNLQQLVSISQFIYTTVEKNWGHLCIEMEPILIYAPMSIRNIQSVDYDELIECALGLELFQIAQYLGEMQTEAEPADIDPPTELTQTIVEVKSDKVTHWNIFNNAFLLLKPIETIAIDENGLPLKPLVLNYYGTALTLSDFQFSQNKETVTAKAELISSWYTLKDATLNTTCEINASKLILEGKPANLKHGHFEYRGLVGFKKNQDKKLTGIIPLGDGIFMFSLDNGKKIHHLEGKFTENGLINVDTASLLPDTENKLKINQKDIFKNSTEFNIDGEIFIPANNLKYSGIFLYTNDKLLPVECDMTQNSIHAKLKVDYLNNEPIFVHLERNFEKQKLKLLASEKNINFELTYSHHSLKDIVLKSSFRPDTIDLSSVALKLLRTEKWYGETQLVLEDKVLTNINLGKIKLDVESNQWKIDSKYLSRKAWEQLPYASPLLNFSELIHIPSSESNNFSSETHNCFEIRVVRPEHNKFKIYFVETPKENSSNSSIFIHHDEKNPNTRYELKINGAHAYVANIKFQISPTTYSTFNIQKSKAASSTNTMAIFQFSAENMHSFSGRTINGNILENLSNNNLTHCKILFGDNENYILPNIKIESDLSSPENSKVVIDKKLFFSKTFNAFATSESDIKNQSIHINLKILDFEFKFKKTRNEPDQVNSETQIDFKENLDLFFSNNRNKKLLEIIKLKPKEAIILMQSDSVIIITESEKAFKIHLLEKKISILNSAVDIVTSFQFGDGASALKLEDAIKALKFGDALETQNYAKALKSLQLVNNKTPNPDKVISPQDLYQALQIQIFNNLVSSDEMNEVWNDLAGFIMVSHIVNSYLHSYIFNQQLVTDIRSMVPTLPLLMDQLDEKPELMLEENAQMNK